MINEKIISILSKSVHDTVEKFYEDPENQSLAYSVVGAHILSEYTGDLYTAMGGCLQFQTHPGDEEGPYVFAIESDDPDSPDEYHFWIAQLSEQGDKAFPTSVLDLSTRHFHQMAKNLGIPWQRSAFPEFVWESSTGDVFDLIFEKHGIDIEFNPDLIDKLDEILAAQEVNLRQVAEQGKKQFLQNIEKLNHDR